MSPVELLTVLHLAWLISIIFGWQFSISRQYLKIIEAIFYFGQKHIEKVEGALHLEDEEDNEESGENSGDDDEKNQRQANKRSPDAPPIFLLGDNYEIQHEFQLEDACALVHKGITAVIDDQVTKRFNTEELRSWNLLTRTNIKNYQFMSVFLGLSWLIGFIVRYFVLLPVRIYVTFTGILWLICSMAIVGCLPEAIRSKVYWHISLMSFRMVSCGITATLEFHNQQYRAKEGDICVANHTSPIDVVVLACDNCYALVGQRHGGFLGMLEKALSRAANHVWFDRSEMRDRQLVVKRLKEHVSGGRNYPILIFPEGTCINNSAVMMFKKR